MSKANNVYETSKILQQTQIIETDENGEIKTKTETNVTKVPKEPHYIKLYLQDILYLKDMPRGLNPVLHVLLKNIQWGNNRLILNSSLKKQMAQSIGLSVATIEKAITHFVKAEIMFREDKGIYVFNPYLFGSGYWEDIREVRMNITYNLQGRTFSTKIFKEIDENEQQCPDAR